MVKKLILLMLCIPIVVMISLYATTNKVSLAIDVPVNDIEINNEKYMYLDIDNDDSFKLEYTIYPLNAKNKDVTITTMPYSDDVKEAELEIKDNVVTAKSNGISKLEVKTADGGYTDSMIIQVDSSGLADITLNIEADSIYVGDKVNTSVKFYPESASNKLVKYSSSNENVATIDSNGQIYAKRPGKTVIRATSEADLAIYDEVEITVQSDNILDVNAKYDVVYNDEGIIDLAINTNEEYSLDYSATLNGQDITNSINLKFDEASSHLTYDLKDYYGEIVFTVKLKTNSGKEATQSIKVKHVEDFDCYFEEAAYKTEIGNTFAPNYVITPQDVKESLTLDNIEVTLSNDNIEFVKTNDSQIKLVANKIGVTNLKIKISYDNKVKEASIDIVVLPKTLGIKYEQQKFGDEELLTLGGLNKDGTTANHKLEYYTSHDNKIGSGFNENIKFTSSNNEIKISNDGTFTIPLGFNDVVAFRVEFSYNDISIKSKEYKIRLVGNAYNVNNYNDLYDLTSQGKAVVLGSNIKLPLYNDETLKYETIKTTYDYQYYINKNQAQPEVYVLLPIRNNIYGNGYTIDASLATTALDETGALKRDALFRGPLDFVGIGDGAGAAASVKAQDNIAFGVYENVNLTNVTLIGGGVEPKTKDDVLDLTTFDYSGTTVEILGDNINISYSRIKNGRTVLRAFGDISDPNKEIHVNIEKSVLSNAREFIIRMGSNAFIMGNKENPSPMLPGDDGSIANNLPYSLREYNRLDEAKKKEYDEKYIKTFITLDNVILENSGIFSVGIDSHFSGPALAGGWTGEESSWFGDWKDLAKTSYGAKLSLKNEVRIYDWKDIESVNSDTLITVIGNNPTLDQLKFDVAAMLKELAKNPKYSDIIYNDDTHKDYVHGGIAFFGGGKNYGVVDTAEFKSESFASYEISLGDVGQSFLEIAAGDKPFYFALYNSNSVFNPVKEEELISSGHGYDIIKP